MRQFSSRILIEGEAEAPLLKLESDISFWGDVDPTTGKLINCRHPQAGECISGKILAVKRSIGSSSGSAILLELMRLKCGPAGIILVETDFIVTLGAVVAREMGYGQVPVIQIEKKDFPQLPGKARITRSGELTGLD